ncbi:hypothetical protein JTE90_002241 [Oedothorax gibbosus]|uniref:Dehydrogenase/reductase SDR family member 7 n=1 Tax=Oedothorax gibbosus TaxID=931172 RepID=A0AAV6V5J8_9ARAC|nr:hypothetical protein JTE90_002241 [Oedothorax gibbosus]
MPSLPHIPLPKIPHISWLPITIPHIPVPYIPYFNDILGILLGGLFGLIAVVFTVIGAIGVLIAIPLWILPAIWFLFFNDRNISLGIREYIGKGIKKYSGKVVWIVGVSTTLGKEMALELATVGAKLILSARKVDILEELKEDCIEISNGKLSDSDILVLPFDITEMEKEYVDIAIEEFGKIDVFINNTGHNTGLIELNDACKTDIDIDISMFDSNFFAPAFLTKQVVKHFMKTGGGEIIAVSSIVAKGGLPGQAAFSASKKALNGYLDCLRLESSRHKIFVTTVCPGLIHSSDSDSENTVFVGTSEITQEEQLKITRKGLKPKRCAHLILVAGANRLTECWVANQPFLLLTYLAQYNPWVHRYVMGFIFSKKRLEKIYEGIKPNIWIWRPLFVI